MCLHYSPFQHLNEYSKPHYNPDRPGDLEHIFLDLEIDFTNQIVKAKSETSLKILRNGVQNITLQAVDMEISQVKLNQKKTNWEYDGKELTITSDKPLQREQKITLQIKYELHQPKLGLIFVKPTKDYPNKPTQVWSAGESEDSRYWFPSFDYPTQLSTFEIRAKVPRGFTVLSNGNLIEHKTQAKTETFHWKQDTRHPNYLTAFVAGEFQVQTDKWRDIPVNYYTRKDIPAENLVNNAGATPAMMEFFSNYFGVDYPYPKYHQVWVHDFTVGGLECTSMTLNTDEALPDKTAKPDFDFAENLIAHELTHQWFGDLVVIRHWEHVWVKEGFATYGPILWWEESKGLEEGQRLLLEEQEEYLAEDKIKRVPIASHSFENARDVYNSGQAYAKGAAIYHMIRQYLGEGLFRAVIQEFLTNFSHKNADSYDLLNTISKVTGLNLKPLFDQYVYRGGHPDFEVGFSWDPEHSVAKLTVDQKQMKDEEDKDNLFNLEIPLALGSVNKNKVKYELQTNLKLTQKTQTFYFPLTQKPDLISFDHGSKHLKETKLNYPTEILINQAKYGIDLQTKIQALRDLAKKTNLKTLQELKKLYKEYNFWFLRAETIKLISKFNLDQAEEFLIQQTKQEKHGRVLSAIYTGLSKYHTVNSFQTLLTATKKKFDSYVVESNVLSSLAKIAWYLGKQEQIWALQILREKLQKRDSWLEIVRTGALRGLAGLRDNPEAVKTAIQYLQPGNFERLRMIAAMVLAQMFEYQEENLKTLILAELEKQIGTENMMIQRGLVWGLSQIQDIRAIPLLQKLQDSSFYDYLQVDAREGIKSIQKNLKENKKITEISKKIEKITKENRELKSQLEELQVKVENPKKKKSKKK